MRGGIELDATDWKILRELQHDGRITNVELAGRAGLSPPPCLRRVKALERAGIIARYRALREDHAISGEAGFLLKCVAKDLTLLQDFIIHDLTSAPNVENVKTTPILRVAKYDPGVPIP